MSLTKEACLIFGLLQGVALLNSECVSAAELAPGLNASASLTQDYFRDAAGGISRGDGAPSALHMSVTWISRYWGEDGSDRLHIDILATAGSSISSRAGDLQGLDNVEATNTVRLYETWYEHDFAGTGSSVRLGVQDYNALFDALDTASVFINSSAGLDPTISQIGISTFPEPGLGIVYQWHGKHGRYLLGGVYDGTPGLPGDPYGTHIEWRSGDGAFSVVEAGIGSSTNRSYKLGIGAWYDTRPFQDPSGRNRNINQGAYLMGERTLAANASWLPWTTGLYFRVGLANAARNTLAVYMGAGITLSGVLPGRPGDQLGLAVNRAGTGSAYRSATAHAAVAETALELTYQYVLSTHLSLQPDIQYIINPGADSAVDNAWIVGARVQLSW